MTGRAYVAILGWGSGFGSFGVFPSRDLNISIQLLTCLSIAEDTLGNKPE